MVVGEIVRLYPKNYAGQLQKQNIGRKAAGCFVQSDVAIMLSAVADADTIRLQDEQLGVCAGGVTPSQLASRREVGWRCETPQFCSKAIAKFLRHIQYSHKLSLKADNDIVMDQFESQARKQGRPTGRRTRFILRYCSRVSIISPMRYSQVASSRSNRSYTSKIHSFTFTVICLAKDAPFSNRAMCARSE